MNLIGLLGIILIVLGILTLIGVVTGGVVAGVVELVLGVVLIGGGGMRGRRRLL